VERDFKDHDARNHSILAQKFCAVRQVAEAGLVVEYSYDAKSRAAQESAVRLKKRPLWRIYGADERMLIAKHAIIESMRERGLPVPEPRYRPAIYQIA